VSSVPLSFMYPQVVTVWEYARKQLTIKQCLYGHTDAVTCLAASPAYNVIVSGSRDATAIIWDLSRRIFVRQLRGHAAPVAAVAINELTVSCFMPGTHKILEAFLGLGTKFSYKCMKFDSGGQY
jgi:WD40 repeat protein